MTEQTIKWKGPFFTIAVGQMVSLIGSSAVQFALIWWLAIESDSPMMMAYAGVVAFLPQFLLGPFAGVWIDRLKRKYVVIIADMFIGVGALLFAIFFYFYDPPFWMAIAVLGIRSLGGVFHFPAISSIIPMLVPKEFLVTANSWTQFMQSGAFILGPVIGAVMFAAMPMYSILAVDFLGAAVASICVAVVKIKELPPKVDEAKHFFLEMKEGAFIFLQDRKLFAVTIMMTASMIFFLPLSSYYPLMASGYFKVSAIHGSIVEVAFAAGMMLAAFAMGYSGNIERKFMVIHLGLLGTGATALICGILPTTLWAFWIFTVICALMGASMNVYNIPYMAYIQEVIPPEAMGRVFSLIGSAMSLSMPLGLFLSGPIAEKYGVPLWFLLTGIATIVFVGMSSFYLLYLGKKERKQERDRDL